MEGAVTGDNGHPFFEKNPPALVSMQLTPAGIEQVLAHAREEYAALTCEVITAHPPITADTITVYGDFEASAPLTMRDE